MAKYVSLLHDNSRFVILAFNSDGNQPRTFQIGHRQPPQQVAPTRLQPQRVASQIRQSQCKRDRAEAAGPIVPLQGLPRHAVTAATTASVTATPHTPVDPDSVDRHVQLWERTARAWGSDAWVPAMYTTRGSFYHCSMSADTVK
jgi:hypothetical protein